MTDAAGHSTQELNKTCSKRFNLFKHFSLISLSGFLLAAGALSTFYRQQATRDLATVTEENNIVLTQILSNTLWGKYGSFLFSTESYSDAELLSSPTMHELTEDTIKELEGSNIAKVKIYDMKGRTIFSTDASQIGNDKSQSEGYLTARSGQVASQLDHRDTFKTFNVTLEERDLLSSYVPIYLSSRSNRVIGVFEVYTDITPLFTRIKASQRDIYLGSFLILIVLYGSLVLVIRRADKLLTSQYQQVQSSKEQYRQQSQELASALTDLKRTQSQMLHSEKMSGLGQMVAGVAHEINNPVNFIHGNLHHVKRYVVDLLTCLALYEEQCEDNGLKFDKDLKEQLENLDIDFVKEDLEKTLSSMTVGTSRIQEIVLSLRNFSRLDEADCKVADIHAGLESTLMLLGHRLKDSPDKNQIQIIRDFDQLPPVECYAGQLNQVFMNILSNAIDALEDTLKATNYTQESPKITLRTETRERSVVISIADNGTGIPKEIKDRIFDPFFTTKEIGKGTGMGMAISHQIITEQHKGKIECFSDAGIGTEFIIEIPRQCPG